MARYRAHIVFPKALLAESDALVGPRGRNAFLAEAATREVRIGPSLTYQIPVA